MKYLLIITSLILIGCGKKNTTSNNESSNRFKDEIIEGHEKIDLEAKLKITMFSGNLIQTEAFDLKVAPLEKAMDLEKVDTNRVKTKNLVFYISNLDKRIDFINNMNESSLAIAEIQVEKPKNKNLSGTWGWLSHDGAITQKEALKTNNLDEKIVFKIEDKSAIESLLKNKIIFSMWLDNLEVESSLDQSSAIKVQSLVYKNTFEVDRDQEINQGGFVQLKAYKRTFKTNQHDYPIRYFYWEEVPGRHDKRFIKQTGVCHVRIQGIARVSETEVALADQIEINYQDTSEHWVIGNDLTSISFKNAIASKAERVGLVSMGSCHGKSDFIDAFPGTSQGNIADRIIIKANVYERLP